MSLQSILAGMIDRRSFLVLGAAPLALADLPFAQAGEMSRVTAYAFTFKGLDGGEILLASYAGHPILVVNTASLCGYTPQYAGLQALWTHYRDRGLVVLGVPSNDFGGQEPGGAAEIQAPRKANTMSPSRSPKRRRSKARKPIRFTDGRRTSARWKRRAGISTNT